MKALKQCSKRIIAFHTITHKPLNLHLLFEREHQIVSNALTVLFKHFIYASLFSKQHFRIANCIQANEKLVTPRFTPFSGGFIMFLPATLKKTCSSQNKRKKVKLRKPQTLLPGRTISSNQHENYSSCHACQAPPSRLATQGHNNL